MEALQCLYLLSWEGHADGGQQVSMSPAADQNQNQNQTRPGTVFKGIPHLHPFQRWPLAGEQPMEPHPC